MKKSTKILLCLCVVFFALGFILTGVGMALGANPIKAFHDGLMTFTFG